MATKKSSTKAAKAKAPAKPPTLHGVPHNPDVDVEPRKWTRKEAEQSIRDRAFRCAGPRIPERMAQWQEHMAAGRVEEARQIVTRGLEPIPGVYVPCNQDLTEEIISRPFDGSDQERVCPKCGTVNSWRQPTFDGLDES